MSKALNVFLCDTKIGVLHEDELAQLSFQYDTDATSKLSVHLPIREEPYPHISAYPFFENLTPEGEAFDILTSSHSAGNKTFSILDRFGGDCAGAIALYEDKPVGNIDDTLTEITDAKLAQIIDNLPNDPLLTGMENPPRLSLAGAQSKFAVCKIDGKYYRSDDNFPTTHIIKITNKRFPDLLENELFCMKLALSLGFSVPNVALKSVDGRQYLEIERFDRQITDGKITRIHQEDFCQATGLTSDKKYQKGGGARLKDCYGIIDTFSDNKLTDITRFVEWIVFNYLIGNTDAHAKNISLLHTDSGIKLAPFYDLLSTEVYPEKIIDHETAMLINGKGKYDALRPYDFTALFENLGLNATNILKSIKSKFPNIIELAETLQIKLSAADNPIYDDIISIIKKRAAILFG